MSYTNRPLYPSRSTFPCKGCKSRTVGCHSVCEKYLTAKAENEKKREAIHGIAKEEDDYDDYKIKKCDEFRKKRYRKR